MVAEQIKETEETEEDAGLRKTRVFGLEVSQNS